ncbi:MAG: hypothetical protein R3E70_14795 [Burkholderiaceae bacterium]
MAQSAELQADYTALVAAHGRFSTEKALQSALQKRAEFTLADEAGVVEASVPRHGELFAELAAFDDPADALFDHAPTAELLAEAAAVLAQASAPTFAAKGVELRDALAAARRTRSPPRCSPRPASRASSASWAPTPRCAPRRTRCCASWPPASSTRPGSTSNGWRGWRAACSACLPRSNARAAGSTWAIWSAPPSCC